MHGMPTTRARKPLRIRCIPIEQSSPCLQHMSKMPQHATDIDDATALCAADPPKLQRAISRGYAEVLLCSPTMLANLCKQYFVRYDTNCDDVLEVNELLAIVKDLRRDLCLPLDTNADVKVHSSIAGFSTSGNALNREEFVLWFSQELRDDLEAAKAMPMLPSCPDSQSESLPAGCDDEDAQADVDMVHVEVCLLSGASIVSNLDIPRSGNALPVFQAVHDACGDTAWRSGALVAKLLLDGEAQKPRSSVSLWPDTTYLTLVWVRPEVFVGPSGAATTGNIEEVRHLLDLGVPVDWRDGSRLRTALMWAASEGQMNVVQLLLAAGADPSARAMGATASSIADANGYPEIASYISSREVREVATMLDRRLVRIG